METDQKTSTYIALLLEMQDSLIAEIKNSPEPADQLKMKYFSSKSELSQLMRQIKDVPASDRSQVGTVINQVKRTIEEAITQHAINAPTQTTSSIDITAPGVEPTQGHLHIVSQAIAEITRIFERISFTRVRHPEVDWDYYAFESLNMPANHPARDEWETFFIDGSFMSSPRRRGSSLKTRIPDQVGNDKKTRIVLTPHTSNGQVREMEKGKLPIRMINIAKCYRRQSDVSHAPMFHQFEGLYIDKNVSIGHLKGVIEYFFKQFYGPDRKVRLRPFHFQFTEPSFEIDVSCGVCGGTGVLKDKSVCKICKEGWLELGGAGMVHPNVLKSGGIDTTIYNGFAFGWGVERTYMMKAGTRLDDIRLLYGNDVRFLEQF